MKMPSHTRLYSLVASLVATPLLAFVALVSACGGGAENLPPPPPPPAAFEMPASTVTTAQPDPPPAKAAPLVTLLAGAASPDPTGPLPTVQIKAPARNQVVSSNKASDFAVMLDVKNWPTAQGSSHVHLIVDNRPYKAIYDTKAPIKLAELTAGEALAEGQHWLVAFPSRANHESVKTKGALAVVPFWVGKPGTKVADPGKKPMLIYSRPKGEYNGDMANHVLVDFQIANVSLAEGKEHVHVAVTGPGIDHELASDVTSFGAPLYLDNLGDGSYALKVDLVDGSGKPMDGAWNSTTRTIKVNHNAPMDPSMGHGSDAKTPTTGSAPAAPTKKR